MSGETGIAKSVRLLQVFLNRPESGWRGPILPSTGPRTESIVARCEVAGQGLDSWLLGLQRGGMCNKEIKQIIISKMTLLAFRYKRYRDFEQD